jgi:hypothetical protein
MNHQRVGPKEKIKRGQIKLTEATCQNCLLTLSRHTIRTRVIRARHSSDCVGTTSPHVTAISTLNLLFWFIDAGRAIDVEKVCDIVGLPTNRSDNARVLCVDEKAQVQALVERT